MKKNHTTDKHDELRAEYDLTKLKSGVRGKHLVSYRAGTNLALLSPDVRAAFPTDKAVNRVLRSAMKSRPRPKHRKNARAKASR